MNYAVRITRTYADVQQWVGRVAMVSEKVVVYEHSENVSRIHIHAHIWGCAATDDTLKNWLSEALNVKVKKYDIAFKTQYKPRGTTQSKPIDDGNISYMSKGKYDPLYVKGYTDEEINGFKKLGFDKKEDLRSKGKTGDEALYNEFCNFILYECCNEEGHITFKQLKKDAMSFCDREIGIIMNSNYMNKYNMLIRTFDFRHYGVVIEKEDDTNNKIWKNWIV